MENREEKISALLGTVEPTECDVVIGARTFGRPRVYRVWCTEDTVNGLPLWRRGLICGGGVVDGVLSSQRPVPGALLWP